MKTFRKLLMTTLALAVVVCGISVAVSASAVDAATVSAYVIPETDVDGKIAVRAGAEQLVKWAQEGGAEQAVDAKTNEFVLHWLDEIADPDSTDEATLLENTRIIIWLNYAAKNACTDWEFDDYAPTKAALDDAFAKIQAATLARKHILAGDAPLNEYDCSFYYTLQDFEDASKAGEDGKYVSAPGFSGMATTDTTLVARRENGAFGSSGYLWYEHLSSGWTTAYHSIELGMNGSDRPGCVFELDIMPSQLNTIFGPEGGRSSISGDSNNKSVSWFAMKDCSLYTNGCSSEVTGTKASALAYADCFAPGEWTHFSFVFDYATNHIKYYINYCLVLDEYAFGEGVNPVVSSVLMRTLNMSETFGVGLDNIVAYAGTAIRESDYFDGMSDAEKFIHYVAALNKEELSLALRLQNYEAAKELIASFYDGTDKIGEAVENAELGLAVDAYVIFEAETLDGLKQAAFDGIGDFITQLKAIARTTGTLAARLGIFNSYENYLIKYADYINQTSKEFAAYAEEIAALRAEYNFDNSIITFKTALEQFGKAPVYLSKLRYFTRAQECYETYGYAAYDGTGVEALPELVSALTLYHNIEEKLAVAKTEDNSRRAVALIAELSKIKISDFLKMSYVNDIDNHTSDECITNRETYDKVLAQITVIEELLTEGAYAPEYEGLEAATAVFSTYQSAVGAVVYQSRLEHIREMMELYKTSTIYTEKKAICYHIINYIEENDITIDAEIQDLIERCNFYLEVELPAFLASYEEYLKENAALFIDTVERLSLAVTYTDMAALYDKALSLYYYMDVNTPEVEAAIEALNPYEEQILTWRNNSNLFILAVAEIANAKTNDEKYVALAAAAQLLPAANQECEGMKQAMRQYNNALAIYQAGIVDINNEIQATCETVLAERNNFAGAVTVVAVFRKKFF